MIILGIFDDVKILYMCMLIVNVNRNGSSCVSWSVTYVYFNIDVKRESA